MFLLAVFCVVIEFLFLITFWLINLIFVFLWIISSTLMTSFPLLIYSYLSSVRVLFFMEKKNFQLELKDLIMFFNEIWFKILYFFVGLIDRDHRWFDMSIILYLYNLNLNFVKCLRNFIWFLMIIFLHIYFIFNSIT